jgi:CRP/FNR family transcriptional regulator, cyclic AMP receptor protein
LALFPYILGNNFGATTMMNFRARVFGYRQKEGEEASSLAVLEGIPIFKDLNKRELSAIERILHRREYIADELVIRQGEPGMGMYIIESGKVVVLSEPAGVQLSELSDGDFFGEVSLLDETPRSATVVAKCPTRILGFFQSDLFSLIERNPRLGVKIVIRLTQFLGERLKRANQQVLELTEQLRQQPAEATTGRKNVHGR